MNQGSFLQRNMGVIALILVAVILWWGYTTFIKSPADIIEKPGSQELVGKDVIETLKRLKGLTLDGSIFLSPEFQNLKDFNLIIPEQPVGRVNPFAPIR